MNIRWQRLVVIASLFLLGSIGLLATFLSHAVVLESIARWLVQVNVLDDKAVERAPACSFDIQLIMLTIFGGILALAYGSFVKPLARYLHDHPIQSLLFLFLIGSVWGWVGPEFGIPDVIWGVACFQRILSGLAASVVLALLGINAYYLDERPTDTSKKVRRFLEFWEVTVPDEHPKLIVEMVQELGRFLYTLRLPFLVILTVPALFTSLFTAVPKLEVEFLDASNPWWLLQTDILGFACWMTGLVVGVALVNLCLKMSIKVSPYSSELMAAGADLSKKLGKEFVRLSRYNKRYLAWAWRKMFALWSNLIPDAQDLKIKEIRQRQKTLVDPRQIERRRGLVSFTCVFATAYYLIASFLYGYVSPGVAVFSLLGMAIAIDGLFCLLVSYQRRVFWLGLTVIWVAFANQAVFKLQFDNLSYDDRSLVELARLDPRIEEASPTRKDAQGDGAGKAGSDKQVLTPSLDGQRLVSNHESLEAWLNAWRIRQQRPSGEKPKLTIVACSGGGVRGAHWSASVLSWLDSELHDLEFHESLRLISASSASAVGAGYYIRRCYDDSNATLTPDQDRLTKHSGWLEKLPSRGLDTIAPAIALSDVPSIPFFYANTIPVDRGKRLEMTWDYLRDFPLFEVRELERSAELPSLIFSPILVEDGRRLLISNLDLSREARPKHTPDSNGLSLPEPTPRSLAVQRGSSLVFLPLDRYGLDMMNEKDRSFIELLTRIKQGLDLLPFEVQEKALKEGTAPLSDSDPVLSVSGFEFTKLFARERGFRMATAARMTATFPFITPAVYLPTRPAVRVVDSGFRDNYGVEIAADWIFQNREWLRFNTSGVLLIQIRCFSDPDDRLRSKNSLGEVLARGFQLLWSVPQAAANTFSISAVIRNDRLLSQLGSLLNEDRKPGAAPFFTTVVFELPSFVRRLPTPPTWPEVPSGSSWRTWEAGPGAYSWSLTPHEAKAIHEVALPQKKLADEYNIDMETNSEVLRKLDKCLDELKHTDPARRFALLWEYERARNYQRLLALRQWWKSH